MDSGPKSGVVNFFNGALTYGTYVLLQSLAGGGCGGGGVVSRVAVVVAAAASNGGIGSSSSNNNNNTCWVLPGGCDVSSLFHLLHQMFAVAGHGGRDCFVGHVRNLL